MNIKTSGITITLAKEARGPWSDLKPKKTMIKKSDEHAWKDKSEKTKDPQGDLMQMMKEMYQNGDDDMKKMIGESWTKSQDDKTNAGQ